MGARSVSRWRAALSVLAACAGCNGITGVDALVECPNCIDASFDSGTDADATTPAGDAAATDSADASSSADAADAPPIDAPVEAPAKDAGLGTVPPQVVSGNLANCTTAASFAGRKAAIDAALGVYVAMICGSSGYVAYSSNGGVSYGQPVLLPFSGKVTEMAIGGGAAGVAYAASQGPSGSIEFSVSKNGGATWSPSKVLATSSGNTLGVSISLAQNDLYVAAWQSLTTVNVFHNDADAVGSFSMGTASFTDIDPYDVLSDPLTGDVWAVGDYNGTVVSALSSDKGASFAAAVTSPGAVSFSDWAFGAGMMFTAGSDDQLTVIPASAPAMTTQVVVGVANARERAVSADRLGNAYVVSNAGGVTLQRILANATAVESTRMLGVNATNPGIQAGPPGTAVVVYTQAAAVYATVQTY